MGQPATGAATCGIRPEHITIRNGGVPTTIVVFVPAGSEIHINAKLGNADITPLLRERVDLHTGQKIPIIRDLTKVHLFGENGTRLN